MVSYSRFEQQFSEGNVLQEYDKLVEPISDDYEVYVNGERLPVYTCRISKVPFNRIWPGHQRERNQSELASFVNIVGDAKIDLKVVVHIPHEKVSLRPFSKNIPTMVEGNEVSFTLEENGHFILTGDDFHHCLYLFYSKPIPSPKPEEVTYYFGPGIHLPGKITLKDNDSVYVDKDALVYGCLFARNAKNIRIYGNGLFDDSGEERFAGNCYSDYTNGNVKFYGCENVGLEGVLFRNSAIWCVNIFQCRDVKMDNIKVFGQWRYNTDGVDIVNSQNVVLKNAFVHSFDDSVNVKGIEAYHHTNCENILVENCVLWCDWGRACELGLETQCREYKNIVFRNCDILKAADVALDIQNGHCAEISNVLYEDINVEYNSFDTCPMIQAEDDSVYEKYGTRSIPFLIWAQNVPMSQGFYKDVYAGKEETYGDLDLTGIVPSAVHDVTFRNINVYSDAEVKLPISIRNVREGVKFYNIAISGIALNGKPVTEDDVELDLGEIENFSFE